MIAYTMICIQTGGSLKKGMEHNLKSYCSTICKLLMRFTNVRMKILNKSYRTIFEYRNTRLSKKSKIYRDFIAQYSTDLSMNEFNCDYYSLISKNAHYIKLSI